MSENSSHQLVLKSAKRNAHFLAKEKNITKGEALELLAKENGFLNWQLYRDHLLKFGEKRCERLELDDFDPAIHKKSQIRGLTPDGNSIHMRIRTSYLSLINEQYQSIGQLRSYFDKSIKKILSSSKSHAFIFLLVHLDSRVKYPFLDEDAFFDSLLSRYKRLTNIETRYLDRDSTIEDVEEWIKEKEDFFDSHLIETAEQIGSLESIESLTVLGHEK